MSNKIIKNYIYNSIYTTINVLFPLITMPYLARVLLSEGIGKVNYAINIMSWFVLLAALGVPRYGVREIAKAKKNNTLSKTFCELFTINIISSIVATCAYYCVILSVHRFKEDRIMYIIVGVQILLNVFNVDWFYQGIEDYKYITNRNIIIKLLSLISIFLLINDKNDYIKYASILVFASVGNYFFNVVHMFRYIDIYHNGLEITNHIKPIIVLFSTQIAVSLYALLDTTMIGYFCNKSNVGYYSYTVIIVRTIVTIVTAVGTVLLPQLTILVSKKKYEELLDIVRAALNVLVYLSFPACIGIFILANKFVLVFLGDEFMPAIITLKILSLLIPIMSIGNLFGTQLLMALNKEKLLLISVFLGAITNMSLNYFLIKSYAQDGAAFASVVTELVVMIVQVVLVKRFLNVAIDISNITKILLSSLFMALILLGVNKWSEMEGHLELIIEVLLGLSSYILITVIFKEKSIMIIVHKTQDILNNVFIHG